MKVINSRNVIIFIILFMSIFVFEMAVNALFPVSEQVESKAQYKDWFIQSEDLENPKIKTVFKSIDKLNADKVLIGTYMSQVKISMFSRSFIEDLNVSPIHSNNENKNVAIVNLKYKELIYEKNGDSFINYRGNAYLVIGTYLDEKDDALKEVMFYIDAASPKIKKDNYYDYIQLSFKDDIEAEQIKNIAKNLFNDYRIADNFDGNYIDTRITFVGIILICACLVLFNCVGFIQKWVSYQKKELAIRKMVGATPNDNMILLYKRFFCIFLLSVLAGTFITLLVLNIIKYIPDLSSTRELFGTRLKALSFILSAVNVLIISNIILGFNLISTKRNASL